MQNKKNQPFSHFTSTLKSKKLDNKQKDLLKLALAEDTKIIFISGPSGSSKTYMAVYSALRILQKKPESDLLYVRTIIESAEKGLGSLPGDLEEKFNPYIAPLKDKLEEIIPTKSSPSDQAQLFSSGRVQARPINYLRGADWKNKVVIADEAQNFTFKELTTLITRIGENTRLFICGDFMQSDINGRTGFPEMFKLFNDKDSEERGIHCFGFTEEDIKRSEILKFIIKRLSNKRVN